jgi:hypothetical protein
MYFMALLKRISQISGWHEDALLVLLFFLILLCNSFVELIILLQLECSKLLQQTQSRGMRLRMALFFDFPLSWNDRLDRL